MSLTLVTIHEHGAKLSTAEAAYFSPKAPLHSAESQHQVIYLSDSSRWEAADQLQSDTTSLEEQSEPEACRGSRTCDLLYVASEASLNLRKKIRELRTQYDQELPDLLHE